MHNFFDFLKGLAATAQAGVKEVIEQSLETLPTGQNTQLQLLTACQTEIWRREGHGEPGDRDAEVAQLAALRDQLLGE